jgi:hypothetical protein
MVMQSSMSFAATIRDYLVSHPGLPLQGVYLFWNRLDRRVTMEVFHIYKHIMAQLKLNVLETTLPETFRYSRELSVTGRPFFRSTLLPPMGKLLTGSNLSELAEEILGIIKL